ncbi:NADP-dependent oxidoreductase [Sphingosinicella rhizophila]|uniref:NADP-dependent oxidoreductase n=1 Tax=Sphingosinicella rhizophila TaxID=3050082 RepID=A0ABU3Q424_9SPHN|nr:NADP-dependent oxidoreductase [Sphingosinicella sp. GR2756]MDT9598164.1 NADP-dependent oxidoreductase [Sphingosinicella sp. GR2756]
MAEARAWHLKSRPNGLPTPENFELKALPSLKLEDGWIRVRNHWLSVDPYMRGRMNDVKSYVPPFELDAPMEGGALGTVVESRSPDFEEGETVFHMMGWREEAIGPAEQFNNLPKLPVEDHHWLGNLGLTGATAYFGLLRVAEAKAGDIVFVSAAAGAVGSAVVQIAKAKGMEVIGSAAGEEKCAWVKSLGADAAVDYKAEPILKGLMKAAPKGIDVYFDNVGTDHLDAAFAAARNNARFAICGMIGSYNAGTPASFRFIMRVISARIMIKGFLYFDYLSEMDEFHRDMGAWVASGQIKSRETIHDGIEAAPEAFLDLFSGANMGKMLVRL